MWWHGRDPTDDEPLTHADLAPAFDLDAWLERIRRDRTADLAAPPGQRALESGGQLELELRGTRRRPT